MLKFWHIGSMNKRNSLRSSAPENGGAPHKKAVMSKFHIFVKHFKLKKLALPSHLDFFYFKFMTVNKSTWYSNSDCSIVKNATGLNRMTWAISPVLIYDGTNPPKRRDFSPCKLHNHIAKKKRLFHCLWKLYSAILINPAIALCSKYLLF